MEGGAEEVGGRDDGFEGGDRSFLVMLVKDGIVIEMRGEMEREEKERERAAFMKEHTSWILSYQLLARGQV